MKIRILQLLCPSRHCLMAAVYESPDGEPLARVVQSAKSQIARLGLPMVCGICDSTDVQFEDAVTVFRSMDEARPEVERQQVLNLMTGDAIERARRAGRN